MSADVTIPSYGVRNRVERTGPAVRAALRPDHRAEFEAEFHAAAVEADDALDLAPLHRVIDRWWPQAVLCANPEIQAGIDEDRRRIAAGDPTVIAEIWYPPGHPHPSRTV
ncbi:hypothetical protein ThrDRAFT_00489 [Frankia casuarinae]|jgi:hypothetical protein|uniref:Uncharacterized protein n=1 Tax=Frankia casuarinae (strain DSM 45818 / CECT 9043 / HFP020203 / CcI3) TaxID=106370 RepID=Q2J672_FRACC|nr:MULTISPECIES: DUF6247 family protein [Frankia]ABD13220.1 hypothetical protein Francci3_3870 [Frankia casuarinae]ETA03910.1 hypothetical protein CcI6DRAFT_00747 [Frankia sp. CcI6]EYT93739.1 hypothetical protein ThrDRAFT_00489 [Frankia casuarinae]KDA40931.1 hypothetical protein BMG523Draft_04240 [Frankia sp. BMG5.23]KEZ34759.1 hypothetical protein CEDDRAFT_03862 [Frankia sp. CeD]